MKKQKESFAYESLGQRIRVEWKVYLLAFVFILIADSIGQIQIPVGKGMFILFPIFYAIILGVLSGPEVLKIVKNEQVKAASKLVVVGIAPFIAKLGITAGANIETILSAGPAVLLHGFGNLFAIILALPVAILLGMKREAVGACFSINREYHMALINNIYGSDSAEARGSLSILYRRWDDRNHLLRDTGFRSGNDRIVSSGSPGAGIRRGRRDYDGKLQRVTLRHVSGIGGDHQDTGKRGRDHGGDHRDLHQHVSGNPAL